MPETLTLRDIKMAEEIIEFDVERRKTRFEAYRQCCKKYHSVAGASPGFLKAPERLYGSQAFKTDIEFGSGDEKSSRIVIPRTLDSRQLCEEQMVLGRNKNSLL